MTALDLTHILGGRLREAINDPSRYTQRQNSADDHQVEPLAEWATRAVITAIDGPHGAEPGRMPTPFCGAPVALVGDLTNWKPTGFLNAPPAVLGDIEETVHD